MSWKLLHPSYSWCCHLDDGCFMMAKRSSCYDGIQWWCNCLMPVYHYWKANLQMCRTYLEHTVTMIQADQKAWSLRHVGDAIYPGLRSRCPGWPGTCWCWLPPSASCPRWMPRQPSRCPPGPPGGFYSGSYEAALHQTTPVTMVRKP